MLVLTFVALLTSGYDRESFKHNEKLHKKNPVCKMCRKVTKNIQILIEQNLTYPEIKENVSSLCNRLPVFAQSRCNKSINKHLPTAYKMILKGTKPKEVCNILKACGGRHPSPSHRPPIECIGCHIITRKIFRLVNASFTEEQIVANLTGVCNKLPAELSGRCNKFVSNYTKNIIEFRSQHLKPHEVCERLNKCAPHPHKMDRPRLAEKDRKQPKFKPCKPCTKFLKVAAKKNITSPEELLAFAKNISLPFVNESNVNLFFKALNLTKPERVNFCKENGFCLPPKPEPRIGRHGSRPDFEKDGKKRDHGLKPCKPCLKFLKLASKQNFTSAEQLSAFAKNNSVPFVNDVNAVKFFNALNLTKIERLNFCKENGFCSLPKPEPKDV